MTDGSYERAVAVWKTRKLPVVVKPISGKLNVRFPKDDVRWPFEVKANEHSPKLVLQKNYWEVPRARFEGLIPLLLKRWGAAYVIQHFTEQKKCAPACRTAQGYDCECTCGGEFHGVEGSPGEWIDISETFSVKRGGSYLSCRLLSRRK